MKQKLSTPITNRTRNTRRSFAPLRLRVRAFPRSQAPAWERPCPRGSSLAAPAAFTFIETLAALFFLAILVPVIIEGITLSSRVSVLTERSASATELAQNKLGELTLNDAWASAEAGGDFGEDWPGYRWEVTQSAWDMDAMTLLAVKVTFSVQGTERSVTLSTLVNPATAGATATSTSSSTPSAPSQTK